MNEFDLIDHYFRRPVLPGRRHEIALGNGDDCALLTLPPGQQMAVSTDMLVEGRHFLPGTDPEALGHKALAVNLSDLAAMGAEPLAFTLALALPRVDEQWLDRFSSGLLALADAHQCALVGGDTTAGPLTLCITVMGRVPAGAALARHAARAGDDIYVSGTVGDARLALEAHRDGRGGWQLQPQALQRVCLRMDRPTPRLALGLALRGVAHAAIDVSDGMAGDLLHVLRASAVDAEIDLDALLEGPALSEDVRALPREQALTCALAGGDDYELLFTAPASARDAVAAAAVAAATPVTRIGRVKPQPGSVLSAAGLAAPPRIFWIDRHGQPVQPPSVSLASFDHFA